MYLMEGLGLAVLGSCLGIGGGILYANLMLTGLTSLWSDAVGTSSLQFSAQPESILYGAVGGVAMALIPILWTLARQGRQPVRELLAGNVSAMMGNGSRLKKWFPKLKSHGMWMGPLAALSAVATLFQARSVPDSERADTFFSAGCFCLIAGLALAAVWLTRAGLSKRLGLSGLALRGCGRRRSRSLATVGLLSCGVFLIVAIGAFRMDAGDHATTRSSGTGGFALMAESSFPVTHDLNSQSGLDFFNLNARLMEGVHVVPFRVHAGDEASCLNLNRAQKPRLLGVNPAWLTEHACFTFAEWDKDFATNQTSPKSWDILKSNSAGNATSSTNPIPAIADQNSIVWAMGKKLGDTLDYTDARGKTFQVRLVGALANSVLQGNLIISETEFLKHFPDESGYRIFLIDAPATNATAVAAEFTRAMSDTGIEVRSAVQRLDEFNAVQNTYLNTFQVLGGLGMLIGSAGLGVVVLRNVQDRRSELALLLAVGFQRGEVESLVLREHAALLLAGLVIGTVSALIAVLPSLNSISQFPFISLGLTLMVVLMSGLLSTWLASRLALRGRLVDSLRSD